MEIKPAKKDEINFKSNLLAFSKVYFVFQVSQSSFSLSIWLSIYPSIYLSIYLSICQFLMIVFMTFQTYLKVKALNEKQIDDSLHSSTYWCMYVHQSVGRLEQLV